MLRQRALLLQATGLALLVLAGVTAHEQSRRQHQSLLRARAGRDLAVVTRLLDGRAREACLSARRAAVRLETQAAGLAPETQLGVLWDELRPDGIEAVWWLDGRGQVVARRGLADGAPPLVNHPLLPAALAGLPAYGIVGGGSQLSIEAVAPLGGTSGRPVSGLVRVAKRLDSGLLEDLSELAGARISAVPGEYVLSRDAVKEARGGSLSQPQAVRVAARAETYRQAVLGPAPTAHRALALQQLGGAQGEPAGLLAVQLDTSDLRPPPEWHFLALLALGVTLLAALVPAPTLQRLQRRRLPQRQYQPWELSAEDPPLERLAAGLSHHLNNAMAVVIGNTEMLGASCHDPFSVQALDDITDSALKVGQVVRLFQKSALQRPVLRPMAVELQQAWDRAAAGVEQQLGQTRALTVIGLSEFVVAGLGDDVTELFVQLLLNAFEATADDGRVRVTAHARGRRVVVTVADDGCGMTPEVQTACTEAFYTTHGPCRTGLGLTAVSGIVRRHGGHLSLRSQANEGCDVTFDLALWESDAT